MFAVIETGGKQYKVAEGDVVRIEKLEAEVGEKVTFADVLLIVKKNDEVLTGEAAKGGKVAGEVVRNGKGKKIRIFKYKPKTGYRKRQGHRQPFTEVKIMKITVPRAKAEVETEIAAKAASKATVATKSEVKTKDGAAVKVETDAKTKTAPKSKATTKVTAVPKAKVEKAPKAKVDVDAKGVKE